MSPLCYSSYPAMIQQASDYPESRVPFPWEGVGVAPGWYKEDEEMGNMSLISHCFMWVEANSIADKKNVCKTFFVNSKPQVLYHYCVCFSSFLQT